MVPCPRCAVTAVSDRQLLMHLGLAHKEHLMNPADIDNRFDFHAAPDEEKVMAHTSARNMLKVVAQRLDNLLPDGREKSLAITKLEEAMFWANAALARMPRD